MTKKAHKPVNTLQFKRWITKKTSYSFYIHVWKMIFYWKSIQLRMCEVQQEIQQNKGRLRKKKTREQVKSICLLLRLFIPSISIMHKRNGFRMKSFTRGYFILIYFLSAYNNSFDMYRVLYCTFIIHLW